MAKTHNDYPASLTNIYLTKYNLHAPAAMCTTIYTLKKPPKDSVMAVKDHHKHKNTLNTPEDIAMMFASPTF